MLRFGISKKTDAVYAFSNMRGLIDRKGEQFAYLQGGVLYTLEGEPSGRLEGNFVVDLAGNRIWRVVGDAVYTLSGMEPVGFFSGNRSSRYD